jgi:predicted nucleic acid-binding protein
MVSSGNLTLCIDARVLSEYHEVLLRPKFHFDPDQVATILDYIERTGWVVSATPLSVALPDRDDEVFLEVAISNNAGYLVTGNAVHFPSTLCQGVKVAAPSEFLKRAVRQQKIKKKGSFVKKLETNQ